MTTTAATTTPTTPGQARLQTGLGALGSLRWVAVDITSALEEARRRLDLSPIAAVALGRALAGAALVQRIVLKVPSRLVLEIVGDGSLGKIIAEANREGGLRGLVGNPQHPTPEAGLKIAPLIGKGTLRVTREGSRRSYSSQVELVSGELGDDLTHYLEQSEQIRSAVLLGVLVRPEGIAAAGGLIVEALPGTDPEVIDRLERNISHREGVSVYLERGGLPALVEMALHGFDREPLDSLSLEYRCGCDREKLLHQLIPIATQELDALLDERGVCRAECAFCGEIYEYAAEELTETN
jgi:molecular chaperone Hsp33